MAHLKALNITGVIFIALFMTAFLVQSVWASTVDCIEGNCQDGYGAYLDQDGVRHEGVFKDGNLEGEVTLTFVDGTKFVGLFDGNMFVNDGTYISPEGQKYKGHCSKDGLPVHTH